MMMGLQAFIRMLDRCSRESNWTFFVCVLLGLALLLLAISLAVGLFLSWSQKRAFLDPKNIATLLAAASLSMIYVSLQHFDVQADIIANGDAEISDSTSTADVLREARDARLFISGCTTLIHFVAGPIAILVAGWCFRNYRERLEVVHNPFGADQQYDHLFGGLTGNTFVGFCAPFAAEGVAKVPEERYRLHQARLRRLQHAEYIFSSREAFEKARAFFENLELWLRSNEAVQAEPWWHRVMRMGKGRRATSYSGKLHLYVYKDKHDNQSLHHNYCFFVGCDSMGSRCVLYPDCKTENGIPSVAIVVSCDEEFARFLKGEFLRQRTNGITNNSLETYEMSKDGKLCLKEVR